MQAWDIRRIINSIGKENEKMQMIKSEKRHVDDIPVSEKYSISNKEAAQYFSIGIKKMRRLAEDNFGDFAVYSGNRYLIIRSKFEEYLQKTSSI